MKKLPCMCIGRKFIGYEIDKQHFDISKNRMGEGDTI